MLSSLCRVIRNTATSNRRVLIQGCARLLTRAQSVPRRKFSSGQTKEADSVDLQNGVLGGDTFYQTGIPNSCYSIETKGDETLEAALNKILLTHRTTDPFKTVETDLRSISDSLKELVGSDHPVVHKAATHFFDVAGKRFRPTIVLLMGRALSMGLVGTPPPSTESLIMAQRRLSEITEMIHTASLLHDDVIDTADLRRNAKTVNSMYGNKIAVLGGDFLLARASMALAHLRNTDAVILISTAIEHLAKGEIMQMRSGSDTGLIESLRYYTTKSFYKTASLIANSCKAAAVLAGHNEMVQDIAYAYGTHLGLAFQIIDDMLDVEGNTETLGKPANNDMNSGLATAPVLFAAEEYPQLKDMISTNFRRPGDPEKALEFVLNSQALKRSRELAVHHAQQAVAAVLQLNPSAAQSALISVVDRVLHRSK
eukprot:TRINITY_DN1827_c0_g1_i2.p1 TRINITY_DN1827_c0_g1~~TRINITY_DN1827_c0_g1_i2.p1  ORF type:complete len:426 (-),score=58.84 TRINITY_DN1827_c0_g1_i2:82-1359(-)